MRKLLILAIVLCSLVSCGDDVLDPRISALIPEQARPGDFVDLIGERLDGDERFISIGGQAVRVLFWQERRARFEVPASPAGEALVVVTIDGRRSDPESFYVE